ncbi:MAG: GtrA family protein [Steroidobacteraceae bacterium]
MGRNNAGTAGFVRYSLVGLSATGIHYALLWALVESAGANAGLSAGIGATAGALAAYLGNRRFTFRSDAPHHRALARFALVASSAALANGLIVWAGTDRLRMHYLMAQLTATALILWFGYLLNRRWSFA